MSLVQPHPLWTSAGPSSHQVMMSTVQALMVSGRYRTEYFSRYWSNNKKGVCKAPSCAELDNLEDLHHILVNCTSLEPTRQSLRSFTLNYCQSFEASQDVVSSLTSILHNSSDPLFSQFLLDCSVLPSVISSVQQHGQTIVEHLFRITRTWCFSPHRARFKILGRWSKI